MLRLTIVEKGKGKTEKCRLVVVDHVTSPTNKLAAPFSNAESPFRYNFQIIINNTWSILYLCLDLAISCLGFSSLIVLYMYV